MRIVDVSHWGFLLEHNNMPFVLPFPRRGNMMYQHQLRFTNNFVIIIKTGDRPFFVTPAQQTPFIEKGSHYARLITQVVGEHIVRNMRR